MRKNFALLLLVAATLLAQCTRTINRPVEPPVIPHGSLFMVDAGDGEHLMNIYMPEVTTDSAPYPILFYIHGGSWSMNDKSEFELKQMQALSGGRYAIVSTNYTLGQWGIDKIILPQVINDLVTNVKWLQDNGEAWGLDGRRILVMGHSAGAHLAALCGVGKSYFDAADVDFNAIKGACCLDGAFYLSSVEGFFNEAYKPYADDVTGGWRSVAGSDPAVWSDYIPANIIDPQAPNPPFLLLYSSKYNYRYESNEAFEKALKAAGVAVESHALPMEHGDFVVDMGTRNPEYNGYIADFAARVFAVE